MVSFSATTTSSNAATYFQYSPASMYCLYAGCLSRSKSSWDEFSLKDALDGDGGDIFGVDVMVFFTTFSLTSLCLISFVRLFSSSFISFEILPFLEAGGVVVTSLLLPLLDAADFRVLTALEDEVED